MNTKPTKHVAFTVELDEDTERELRELAAREDRTRRRLASIFLRRAVQEAKKQKDQQPGQGAR